MTQLIFRYDTEDYVNEYAAEGILRAIRPLDAAGITGCFVITGKLIPALRKWGREDVIQALARHEIGTHTLGHSAHPTINEYTDIEDFDEALSRFLQEENTCIAILKEAFGEDILMNATSAPGNSVSYVAQYGYAKLGIREYLGGFTRDEVRNRPVYFCNVINASTSFCLDTLYKLTREEMDGVIDELAEKEVAILCHHPAMNMMCEFWDKVNYDGVNTPEEKWRESTRLSEAEMTRWSENYRYFIERVKKDPRFEIVTSEKIEEKHFPVRERVIDKEVLKQVRKQIEERLFPVTAPDSYSLCDLVFACRDLLLGKEKHICGKSFGFLSAPESITTPVTLTREELIMAAKEIFDTFLPVVLHAGEKRIGVSDFLRAALVLLTEDIDTVTAIPAPWQIDLEEFPILAKLNLKGSWVHAKDFEDAYISSRSRLQSYTIRLPKNTNRMIF